MRPQSGQSLNGIKTNLPRRSGERQKVNGERRHAKWSSQRERILQLIIFFVDNLGGDTGNGLLLKGDCPDGAAPLSRHNRDSLDLSSGMAYNHHSLLIIPMGIDATIRFDLSTGGAPVVVACNSTSPNSTCHTSICCCLCNCMCMACCPYPYLETGPRE